MKKMYMHPACLLRFLLPATIGFLYALTPNAAHGQTYYSTFSDPTGQYEATSPSGGSCTAPAIQEPSRIADGDLTTYAYFTDSITSAYSCTSSNYVFATYLKLLPDSTAISGVVQAGFRISIPGGISIANLSQNIVIQTYLNNTIAETFRGSDIHYVDLGTDSSRFIIYGNTSAPFNRLRLTVKSSIVPLNKKFEFDVYYGVASNASLLPVTITNFKAATAGSNVTVSWQSVNEVNISSYRIEKSSNNGAGYTTVATVAAKGGSAAINYSYTDKLVGNGNYLYRVVAVDKDGSAKATSAVLISIAGKTYLVLLPSVAKAGQNVVVNSGIAGNYQLAVYDLQGRMIKQQQVSNGDKATINTSNLSAGTYVVKIMTPSGNVAQAKFIVE